MSQREARTPRAYAARWRANRAAVEAARADLIAAIRKAVEDGTSQTEIAKALGWPRQRVHKILSEDE
jgi:DNA-directed RNA polymerase specialized sigma24 family protein